MNLHLLDYFIDSHSTLHQSLSRYYSLFDHIFTGLVIFVLFLILAWLLGRVFYRVTEPKNPKIALTLSRLIRNILLVIGIIFALSGAGVNLTGLVAGIGLWALAVGYGMQNIFANIGAGFILMLSGEFNKGDHISVYGNEGIVVSINLRFTILQNGENTLIVPNNLFLTYPVTRFAK